MSVNECGTLIFLKGPSACRNYNKLPILSIFAPNFKITFGYFVKFAFEHEMGSYSNEQFKNSLLTEIQPVSCAYGNNGFLRAILNGMHDLNELP